MLLSIPDKAPGLMMSSASYAEATGRRRDGLEPN